MRILYVPEQTVAPVPGTPGPAVPALDGARVVALERIVQSLREKILTLEKRLQSLEQAPPSIPPVLEAAPRAAPVPRVTPVPVPEVALDAEAFKKNLITKMWKYLNDDERPAKAV